MFPCAFISLLLALTAGPIFHCIDSRDGLPENNVRNMV